MSGRRALPHRRHGLSLPLPEPWDAYRVMVGFDGGGAVREVFLSGGKPTTQMAGILTDGCILLSIALQHDLAIQDLARTLGAGSADPSPIAVLAGVAAQLVVAEAAPLQGGGA